MDTHYGTNNQAYKEWMRNHLDDLKLKDDYPYSVDEVVENFMKNGYEPPIVSSFNPDEYRDLLN